MTNMAKTLFFEIQLFFVLFGSVMAQSGGFESWPDSKILFAASETKVPGHHDGVPTKDMYQCFREPVVVQTKTGRIIVACQAGNKIEWPERSGQDLVIRYSDDEGKNWSSPSLF